MEIDQTEVFPKSLTENGNVTQVASGSLDEV